MSLQSRISSKGQVTVPIEIRRRLGLKQGDRVEFVLKSGTTVISRTPDRENPFENYRGALKRKGNTHTAQRWIAKLRDEDGR